MHRVGAKMHHKGSLSPPGPVTSAPGITAHSEGAQLELQWSGLDSNVPWCPVH